MELDLYAELQAKTNDLNYSIKQLRKNGTAYAEAERQYKILLRQHCLILRDEGMPVTLIDKVCYGIQEVADARFNRDMAESVYDANKEAIQSIKLQMRLIESQLQREWGVRE